MREDRPTCWEASYTDSNGNPFTMHDTATNHCPVSIISDEADEYLGLYIRALSMKEFGVSPFGPDLMEWPAKVVDAFVIFHGEDVKVTNMTRKKPPKDQQQMKQRR